MVLLFPLYDFIITTDRDVITITKETRKDIKKSRNTSTHLKIY